VVCGVVVALGAEARQFWLTGMRCLGIIVCTGDGAFFDQVGLSHIGFVCACVCERESERVYVCVCVCACIHA
jgi:hypothetical protein